MTMKTADFIRKHHACRRGAEWALSISDDMADVWDAMIKQNRHDWLLWAAIRPGVFSGTVVRKLACRFVRETPLSDGRKVWGLLADERSRKAVEVAEAYADGKATESELYAAHYAACVAAEAAEAASWAAADAADAPACVAADAASWAAASCVAADYFAFCASVAAYAVDAVRAARAADDDADAACATYSAAYAAYAADAKSAQVQMIAELGNPFKEESESC
jgi:hypothetical protein